MAEITVTPRSQVRRLPERGRYDAATVYSIIDEALICHVGFVQDGQPYVIPSLHARREDELLLHGAPGSRLMRHLQEGHDVCVAFSLVDGIVLAKSVFNHSVNYRSVVLFGKGRLIESEDDKLRALEFFTEKIMPGRWADARKPGPQEMKATAVVSIAIGEASAKIRSGSPKDVERDCELPVWAGVVPLQLIALAPVPATYTGDDEPVPGYVAEFIDGLNGIASEVPLAITRNREGSHVRAS